MLLDSPRLREVLARCRAAFEPDVVMAFCSGMARFALEPPLDDLPFVLDMVDVDSEKWRKLGTTGPRMMRGVHKREGRLLAAFEAAAIRAARHTLVVNDREREAILRLDKRARVHVVSNGVDVDFFRRPIDAPREPEIVFAGVLNYAPNAAGAQWLVERVWPLVQHQRPDAALRLVGSDPPRRLRRLAEAAGPRVALTGAVPDVRPYLWRARVAAAPLFIARGLQNKVLEAIAAGLPVVTTHAVADGLPIAVRSRCGIADDPEAFAQALLVHINPARPSTDISGMLASFTWARALDDLKDIFADAVARSAALPFTV
jgi:glycosyltransferase involved in cell wall biosynthesis